MARQLVWAFVAALSVGSASPLAHGRFASAEPAQTSDAGQQKQERRDHPGPWWKAPHPAAIELGLTADQSNQIDRIFLSYVQKARPIREELNAAEKALDRVMRANTAEIAVVEQEAARIENKRAEVNRMRTVMLYSIRRVLNAEQILKYDRMEADRRKRDGDRRR